MARTDFEAGDRLVEQPLRALIWPVSQLMTQGAAGSLWSRGFFQGGEGVGDAPLPLIDARQVDPAVGPTELGDLREDRLGLFQFAFLASLGRAFENRPMP